MSEETKAGYELSAGLDPCPFCGGTASVVDCLQGYWVMCDQCAAEGPWKEGKTVAIRAWNRRVVCSRHTEPEDEGQTKV